MNRHRLNRRNLLKAFATTSAVGLVPTVALGQAAQADDPQLQQFEQGAVRAIAAAAEPLPPIEDPAFAEFVDRFADARVVLLGEQSHGTDEFYRARSAITRRLVEQHGFNVIGLEADWPDAARMDSYVRSAAELTDLPAPFARFPAWMWRNHAVMEFLEELRALNARVGDPQKQAGIYGLDIYSLPSSMDAVVGYLNRYDPAAAAEARERYGCLAPWADDPAAYGAQAQFGGADSCADDVLSVIEDVLGERTGFIEASDPDLFHALQNAKVVAAAEEYYRAMYEGNVQSWNLRDTHMFETLKAVLEARGDGSKAVVWAHNSHIGDASATEMGMRGEINIGQLSRQHFGTDAVLIGFGTDRGTVTAASEWNGPAETKQVRPALSESFGALLRQVEADRFLLDLRNAEPTLSSALSTSRLERFIGVLYLPESERWSHYAGASLARQFDALIWLEETAAVEPLLPEEARTLPATHPFALQGE